MSLTIDDDEEYAVYCACGHPQAGPDFKPSMHMLRLNLAAKTFKHAQSLDLPAGCTMPMFQVASTKRQRRMMYSVASSHGILQFAIDDEDRLTLVGEQAAVTGDQQKAGPCHLCLDHTERWLFVCNYDHGSLAVLGVKDDGVLEPPVVYQHGPGAFEKEGVGEWGSGGYMARQEQAHPHGVSIDPSNAFVHVADLGMNAVLVYALDVKTGTLTRLCSTPLHEGAGPRHIDLTSDGKHAYVVNELDNSVTAMRRMHVKEGRENHSPDGIRSFASPFWDVLGTVSSLPDGWAISEPTPAKPFDFYSEPNHSAELCVSPNGRYVYVSNRGHDSIACLEIDPTTPSTLRFIECYPSGGRLPWTFAFAPRGKAVISQNQYSDGQPPSGPGSLDILHVDESSGKLSSISLRWESPHIMSVVVLQSSQVFHKEKRPKTCA